MDVQKIGNRIKQARDLRNYTLDDIATDIGVAKSTIQRYENGLIARPKLPVLQAIANSLRVNPAWIAGQDVCMEDGTSSVISVEYDMTNLMKHTENEQQLLKFFSNLNLIGEREAIKRVKELSMISEYTEHKEEMLIEIPGTRCIEEKNSDTSEDDDSGSGEIHYKSAEFTIPLSDLFDTASDNSKNIVPIKKGEDKPHLIPDAAHRRTDVEITDDMCKHDDNLMDNDDLWK